MLQDLSDAGGPRDFLHDASTEKLDPNLRRVAAVQCVSFAKRLCHCGRISEILRPDLCWFPAFSVFAQLV